MVQRRIWKMLWRKQKRPWLQIVPNNDGSSWYTWECTKSIRKVPQKQNICQGGGLLSTWENSELAKCTTEEKKRNSKHFCERNNNEFPKKNTLAPVLASQKEGLHLKLCELLIGWKAQQTSQRNAIPSGDPHPERSKTAVYRHFVKKCAQKSQITQCCSSFGHWLAQM